MALILFERFGQQQRLNKQAERYVKEGVEISLSTRADQVGACTVALQPTHDLIRALPGSSGSSNALTNARRNGRSGPASPKLRRPLHEWPLVRGLCRMVTHDDRMETAVTAARIGASEKRGAVLAPVAMGAARGLRDGSPPVDRLMRWLGGMESACLTAMRHLDNTEAWAARADAAMTELSGKTPPALRAVLTEWPLVSAPMAEALTGASRAAVLRNLA